MADREDFNATALDHLKKFGGEALIQKVVTTYLVSAPDLIEQVQNAYSNGDLETLKKTAHALKSSTAPVGAEILYDLVTQIDRAASEGDDETLAVLVPQVEPAFLRTKELMELVI